MSLWCGITQMVSSNSERFHDALARTQWDEAAALFESFLPEDAAAILGQLSFEKQQPLFRRIPLDTAAILLPRLPYYDQYVLLHSRTREDMRALVDRIDPDDRMRFFDELPEEAWQRLMDELAAVEGTARTETNEARPAIPEEASLVRETIIAAHQVEKAFKQPDGNEIQVIAPLDLAIESNTICALLGPSGSGKSTLLRILSGLTPPTRGSVHWRGRPVEDNRNVGIVFQSFALFPWLTVLENVEVPLTARGIEHRMRHPQALKSIAMVGLGGFENAYPKELSGGMKQRVGLARALAVEPEVLFMDEPFSALDVLTAENLRSELLQLWPREGRGMQA